MDINISSINRKVTTEISPDIRYLKLARITIIKRDETISINDSILNSLNLTYTAKLSPTSVVSDNLAINSNNIKDISKQTIVINAIINADFPIQNITFELSENFKINLELILHIDTQHYHHIRNPKENFNTFLKQDFNSKILFSAPFGAGKTTFLKLFFDEYENDYSVFHLFPVNYSIAENKDIFEYLKCEILWKLLKEPNLDFDKESFRHIDTVPTFVMSNSYQLFAPFIKLIPNIGGTAYSIIDNLYKLKNEYLKVHKELQIDDKNEALEYLEQFYKETGSLYEDNFISQLIRQLLAQIKQTSEKANILVIDDLDRMDPDHIFRILNVFAAHFDQNSNDKVANKFGFDKVILVCDYNNLEKIFGHRYGQNTDFAGYIDKFYSKEVHFFNHKAALEYYLNKWQQTQKRLPAISYAILDDLINSNEITFRELKKLTDCDFEVESRKYNSRVSGYGEQGLSGFISILLRVFNRNRLMQCIENCRANIKHIKLDEMIHSDYTYPELTRLAIYTIALNSESVTSGTFKYTLNDKQIYVHLDKIINQSSSIRDGIEILDKNGGTTQKNLIFDELDFYTAILDLTKKIR